MTFTMLPTANPFISKPHFHAVLFMLMHYSLKNEGWLHCTKDSQVTGEQTTKRQNETEVKRTDVHWMEGAPLSCGNLFLRQYVKRSRLNRNFCGCACFMQ